MSDLFMIYLDNTNEPQTIPRLFKYKGIQNFYIVKGKDLHHARSVVLNLFKHLPPAVMVDISKCLSGVNLNSVTSHLKNPNIGLWSFIPHGNYKQPGQQVRYPNPDELLKPSADGTSAARNYVPPKPIVPVGQDDTMSNVPLNDLSDDDRKILESKQVPQIPNNSQFTPEQMAVMMQMMQMMMGKTAPQNPIKTERDVPNSIPISHLEDDDLQRRIQANMKPRKVDDDGAHYEPIGGDIDLSKIDG